MRRTSKILAFVLAMLMIVGMLPLSVFAADTTSSKNDVMNSEKDKVTGENQTLKEYVESNGGTLVFGSSFDDASKVVPTSNDGRVNSSIGGNGYIGRSGMTAGGAKVWIDTAAGALRLQSADDQAGDIWPHLEPNVGAKSVLNGETFVMEMTLSVDRPLASARGFFYAVDDGPMGGDDAKKDRSDNRIGDLAMTADGKVGLKPSGASDFLFSFAVGEKVTIAVLCDPVLLRTYFYLNGEFVGVGELGCSNQAIYINGTRTDVKYPSFNHAIRFLQITDCKGVDISLYEMYAYFGVDAPYKTKGTPEIVTGLDAIGANILYFNDYNFVKDYKSNKGPTDADGDGNYEFAASTNTSNGVNVGETNKYRGSKAYQTFHSRVAGTIFTQSFADGNGYFRYIDSGSGMHNYSNIFLEGSYNMTKENVFVLQFDVRGDKTAVRDINFIDRSSSLFNAPAGVGGNNVKFNGAFVSGVASDEFTTVTIIVDTKANKMAIAIDGIVHKKDVTYCSDATKLKAISELRVNMNGGGTNGVLDLDNFLIYSYNTPSGKTYANSFAGYAGDYDGKAKWEQTDKGYWRYYDANGNYTTSGSQTIDGSIYKFDSNGYYSTPVRESVVDFDHENSDGKTMFESGRASYSTLNMVGRKPDGSKWKYSALWTHALYEGFKQDEEYPNAGPNSNPTSPPLLNALTPSTEFKILASGAYVNKNLVRLSTQADIDALKNWKDTAGDKAKRVAGANTIFDFTGYEEVEFKFYLENVKEFYAKGIFSNLNYDIRSATDYSRFHYARDDKFLDYRVSDPVNGYVTVSYQVGSSYIDKTLHTVQLTTSWDPAQSRGDYSMSSVYFLEFNVVKYEAYKGDANPGAQVRTDENGNTVVYSGSKEANGWVTVGDAKYYCDTRGNAAVGVVKCDGKYYAFAEDGKLIENDDDGIYIINGKKYYVKADGTVGKGNYTVNGVKFSTNAFGEITVDGELAQIKYSSYTPTDLTGANVFLKADFQDQITENPASNPSKGTSGNGYADRNVPYIGSHLEEYTAKVLTGTQPADVNFYAIIRQTRWYYVKEADGNVALKTFNLNTERDPYMDIDLSGSKVSNDVVFEASFKLGEDWNASGGLISMQRRYTNAAGKSATQSVTLYINSDGYIYTDFSSGTSAIYGQLSTEEYTKVSVRKYQNAKGSQMLDFYVNDVYAGSWTANGEFTEVTKVRLMQYGAGGQGVYGQGTMYIDNVNMYTGNKIGVKETPYAANSSVQFGDYYRFYNGLYFLGGQWKNDGTGEYWYDKSTGIRFDETGFVDRFYLIDGAKQPYVGAVKLPGTEDTYYFGNDYKVFNTAYEKYVDPTNNDYAYDIDNTGKVIAEYYRGQILATENEGFADVKDPDGNVTKGEYVYDAEAGKNVFVPANGFFMVQNFGALTDISDYSFLNIRMKGNEAATYMVIFGYSLIKEITGYEITGPDYVEDQVSDEDCTDIDLKDLVLVEGNVYKLESEDGDRYFEVTNNMFGESVVYTMGSGWNDVSIALSAYSPELLENVEFIAVVCQGSVMVEAATLVGYYVADESGVALEGWQGDRYYVDGFPAGGWLKIEDRWYYFDPITGNKAVGLAKLPEKPADDVAAIADNEFYYVFTEGGSLKGLADGKVETTVYVFDDEKSEYVATTVTRVFAAGVPVTGNYTDADGNNYYINDTDNSIVTDAYIDTDNDGIGDTYLGSDGLPTIVANQWVEDGDNVSYLGSNGEKVTGYYEIDGKYYFFDENGYLVKSAFVDIDGDNENDLYMDENGNPANGIVENINIDVAVVTMYFVNGVGTANEMVVDENGTAYIYKFDVNGVLESKTAIESDGPVVLIKVVKDGKAQTFVFALDANGSFEKVNTAFEAYNCYYIVIKDEATGEIIATGEAHADLKFPADYTITASTTYVVSYVPVEHDYQISEELSAAPGCLTDGKNVYICANCGHSYFEVVAATGVHVFDEESALVVLEANCWRPGLVEYTCECGYIMNEEIEIDPDNHTSLVESYTDTNGDGVIDDNDKETCTQAATCYGECRDCGYFGYEVKMAEHESDGKWYYADEADAPTCIKKGTASSKCVNCDTILTKVVNTVSDAHPYVSVLDKGIELDGSENVSRYDYHAIENMIGEKTEAEIIAENYSLFQLLQAPTCSVNGLAIYRCLDCGAFVTGAVPTVQENHVWPTDGILEEKQEMCGYVTYDKFHCLHCNVNQNQPEYDEIEEKFEAIKAEGVTEYIWVELGFKIVIVAADGNHYFNFDNLYTTDDETDPLFGYHFNVCEKCFKAINVTAHDYSEYECNGDGTHSRTCDCLLYTVEDATLVPGNSYVYTQDCVPSDEMYVAEREHGETCSKCGENFNVEAHNIVSGIIDGRHVHYCDVCNYIVYDINVSGLAVDKLDATCHDTGYTAHTACTYDGCDYKSDEYEVLEILNHVYSKDTLKSDYNTHWNECELCHDRLFEKAHTWESVDAIAATCISDGRNAHIRCEICYQVKDGSVTDASGATIGNEFAIIKAFGHDYGDTVYNDAEYHWQYCERIITLLDGTTVACTHIGVADGDDDHANDAPAKHTYNNYEGKTGYEYEDYDDEFGTGFRYCDYEGCQHKEWSDDLPTWWGDLGLKLFVEENGNRRYYLEINGEKVTDYVTELTDSNTGITGVYYFDANGYLVLAGDWTEGEATNANPYTGAKDGDKFHTVKADSFAARGAIIAEVVITASNGTYKVIADATSNVSAYVLATGWQEIEGKDYFFYDPDMENVADDAKGGYNGEYFATAKGKMLTGATIYAYAYDKYTGEYVDSLILCNLDAEGAHLLGLIKIGDDAYFYIDGFVGKMTGRFEDDYWCANDPDVVGVYFAYGDGRLYSGKYVSVNGVYYSFDDNYAMSVWHAHDILEFYVDELGTKHEITVYTDGEGRIITTGWFTPDEGENVGNTYYIESVDGVQPGSMIKAEAGKVLEGVCLMNGWYDVDENGVVSNHNGWVDIDGNKGYAIESVLVVSKFIVISEDEVYYFDSDGYLLKADAGELLDVYIGTAPYEIDENGLAVARTLKDHWVRFLDSEGKLSDMVGYFFHNTGLAKGLFVGTIGGATYFFDSNGVMQTEYKYYDAINDKYYIFNANGIGSEVSKEEYEAEDELV